MEIDSTYADLMAYLNLLIRERADLGDTAEEYRRDLATADQWVDQALATKKAQAERAAQLSEHRILDPPPPPPSREVPQRIPLKSDDLERRKIHHVAPVYPPLAAELAIQGTVRLAIVIGPDGRMQGMIRAISGHPLLIPAALDAVKQWEYTPTLLNGKPVEVMAEVSVNFPPDPGVVKKSTRD